MRKSKRERKREDDVCVCVCVCERERERERVSDREGKREIPLGHLIVSFSSSGCDAMLTFANLRVSPF